jgi:hypothetical protein
MKMEQIECSETSAYKIQTPGNHPEENMQLQKCFISRYISAHSTPSFHICVRYVYITHTHTHTNTHTHTYTHTHTHTLTHTLTLTHSHSHTHTHTHSHTLASTVALLHCRSTAGLQRIFTGGFGC